ncbi:MAG: hypothetical protein IKP07_04505 [Bacilli bacterium]|nr:hypothetical protein [Bacilli bacterium]
MAENVSNTYNTDIYIVKSTLLGWKSKMGIINDQAASYIENFRSATNSIENYLIGTFSESYVNNVNNLMDKAIASHNEMSDVEVVLQDVVNKADSE